MVITSRENRTAIPDPNGRGQNALNATIPNPDGVGRETLNAAVPSYRCTGYLPPAGTREWVGA